MSTSAEERRGGKSWRSCYSARRGLSQKKKWEDKYREGHISPDAPEAFPPRAEKRKTAALEIVLRNVAEAGERLVDYKRNGPLLYFPQLRKKKEEGNEGKRKFNPQHY